MKNEKRSDTLPTKPTEHSKTEQFTAFGWVRETKDWFTDLETMLSYLEREASPLVGDSIQGRTASGVLALVQEIRGSLVKGSDQTELYRVLMTMFRLGAAAEDLEQEVRLPREQRIAALEAQITVSKQSLPREMALAKLEIATEYAQGKARSLWQEDRNSMIRTGDMTDIIWAWMAEHPLLLEQRPTMPVLRRWISEVAREFPHASKRGRSKK